MGLMLGIGCWRMSTLISGWHNGGQWLSGGLIDFAFGDICSAIWERWRLQLPWWLGDWRRRRSTWFICWDWIYIANNGVCRGGPCFLGGSRCGRTGEVVLSRVLTFDGRTGGGPEAG